MKKHVYISLIFGWGLMMSALPQSMVIGGGSDNGVLICSQGYLYAWGYNIDNKLGLKPPYNTQTNIYEPREVNIPAGLTFSQVTAGSGGHIVALSCYGVVYAWGSNNNRECGVATGGNISVPTPVKVNPASGIPGYNLDGTPGGEYLGGVKYVCGSTAASFAILNNGRAVGFGGGNWIQTATPTPVYIRRTNATTGPVLENVIHIGTGDNNIYFLIDPDGKGYGDLYSMGNWNGRGGDGGANSYTAEPVETDETNPRTPLKNIKMAIGMDVGGFAVDAITGYVYGWGNGAWGCSIGRPNNESTVYARKVVSGHYKAISGEDFLTDVIEVVGGNGYGAAVTKEGYVLYWGNDSRGDTGGVLPNNNIGGNGNTCATGPQFAVYCTGTNTSSTYTSPPTLSTIQNNANIVKNAVRLSRGDLVGYMINDKNEFYVWGRNATNTGNTKYPGMLGIGNTTLTYSAACMQRMNTIPCDPPDQCPEAYMVGTREKCKETPLALYSGFTTPIGNAPDGFPYSDRYFFRWYRNGTLLNTSTKDDDRLVRRADPYNKTEIMVTNPGTYKVEIEYIGINVPCDACKISSATVVVLEKEMPVEEIVTQTCIANPMSPAAGEDFCFEFNSKYSTRNPRPIDGVFEVYRNQTLGTPITTINTTVANKKGAFCVKGNQIDGVETVGSDIFYSIWIEDKTKEKGTVIKATGALPNNSNQRTSSLLECWSDVVLETVDLYLLSYYGPKTGTITPVIYNVTKSNNREVPGTVIWTGTAQSFSYDSNQPTLARVSFNNYILKANAARGSRYYLGFTLNNVDQFRASANLAVGTGNNDNIFTTPFKDDIDQNTLFVIGAARDNNGARDHMFTNLVFSKTSSYDCGRIKLTSKYNCPPCIVPDIQSGKRVEITTPSGTKKEGDIVTLCAGESVVLTAKQLRYDGANATNQFDILWYQAANESAATSPLKPLENAATSAWTVSAWTLTNPAVAETRRFYVKVQDHIKSTSQECWVWDYVDVKVYPAPAASITNNTGTTELTCTNSSISLTATGGGTYTWNYATNTTPNATVNSAGTYTVTVITNGCMATASVVISENKTPPVANITNNTGTNELTCTLLSINLTATGGVSYSWDNGLGNNASATVTSAGTYTVTVTAANGCTATGSITITADKGDAIADITNNTGTDVLTCTTPSISLTATGEGTYQWSNSLGSNADVTITAPGTYTVTLTAGNGCIDTKSIIITENKNLPAAAITNNPQTNVLDCNTPSITLTATGGGTYSWNDGIATTNNLTVTSGGTYTVTVTGANGCSALPVSVIISENKTKPTAVITNNPSTIILDCNTPSISLTASGGSDYLWDNGLGNEAEITVYEEGTYTVTVTGNNGCTDEASVIITEDKEKPTVSIVNNTNENVLTCLIKNIELTATGEGEYSWNNGLGTGAKVTVTEPGTYTVTATGANGCTAAASVTITRDINEPDVKITNITNTAELTCEIQSISLTATGGETYSWTNQSGNELSKTENLTVTAPGTYTVTATGENGCENSDFIIITQSNATPTLNITSSATTLTCDLTSITLTAKASGGDGNYTYSWIAADTIVTAPGTYTAKVTDGKGCAITANITINEDITPPTVSIDNDPNTTELTCEIQSINLTAKGGATYSWTNQNGNELATTANLTVTASGTYTVTAKDANNGCTNTDFVIITQSNDRPTAIVTPESGILTCETTSIKLTASASGGDGTYTFSWTNAETIATTPDTYIVTVTDGKGCVTQASAIITEDKLPPVFNIVTDPSTTVLTCETTSITLTATGNNTYVWSNGTETNSISVDKAGNYSVTGKAANGCSAKKDITITVNESVPAIVITPNPTTTVLTCTTTSITLTATGGVTFVWNDGSETASISVDKTGTYSVTGTAANGCSNTQSITITADKILPAINVTNPAICEGDNATITASGAADSYAWSTGETGANITVVPTATTTYTVTGTITATGCTSTATATVYVEMPLILTLIKPESVDLGNEITLTVNAEGPAHGYYNWFVNDVLYETTAENYLTLEPEAGKQRFRVESTTTDLKCFAASESSIVSVEEFVPTAINPYNPSGKNCCFMKSAGNRPGYHVEIYNRYMQKIYEGNNGWDGTYRGSIADPGTYFYRIQKKSGDIEKGTLEVIKF